MASAYIRFFRKFRKEHGGPQTMAGNKTVAVKAGAAWRALHHRGKGSGVRKG